MTKQGGIWVEFWMGSSQTKAKSQIHYEYYSYKDGWTEKDKEDDSIWQAEAESWAQNNGGWAHSRYRYGFEILDHPPIEWLRKRFESSKKYLKFYEEQLKQSDDATFEEEKTGDDATPETWRELEKIINNCQELSEQIPVAINGDMFGVTTHPVWNGHIILFQRLDKPEPEKEDKL